LFRAAPRVSSPCMPIASPPFSRRQFLARSLAGAAGIAFAPALQAARHKVDPSSWALLSDTHIAAERAKIYRGVNLAGNLTAVVREILALEQRPAGVLISGDLALNHGESGDYGTLIELLKPLREERVPVHLALGNHDYRERFWDALGKAKSVQAAVSDKQIAMVRSPLADWFLLDSLLKTVDAPGELGEAQRAWLARALDADPHKPAILVLHHNPGPPEAVGSLKDTRELFEIIRPRRQVKAWVYGHSHRWNVSQDDESGIHLINLPPVAYTFSKTDPSGWVHARLQRKGIHLELRCLDSAHPEQGKTVKLGWRA
jgi:3',5'-cyclic-AMP phosphodiesterase